jgi:hypothetical protein
MWKEGKIYNGNAILKADSTGTTSGLPYGIREVSPLLASGSRRVQPCITFEAECSKIVLVSFSVCAE